MENLEGKSLGRYHIIEQLGRGGMAMVYKAYDTRLNRNVAVKVILPTREHSSEFMRRFDREAQAIAQLSHNNIIKVYDYGEEEGTPYLVMEYLAGGTLKERMGTSMSCHKAAQLIAPIARALEYAHRRGIVHRDVKPSNVILTENEQPMLTDFGIAKMLEEKDATSLTAAGVGIGTPEYMAPEQGMGHAVDFRADIYSLGIVFYELVTGRKPFQADTPMAVMIKQMTQELPRPRSFIPSLPDAVEQILFKALAKNPAHRYQTMAEFAADLEKLTIPETIVPGEPKKRSTSIYVAVGTIGLVVICALIIGALVLGGSASKFLNPGGSGMSETGTALTGTWEISYTIDEVVLGPGTNPYACEYMQKGDPQVYQVTLVQEDSGILSGYAGAQTEHLCSAEVSGSVEGDQFTLVFTYKQTGCCKGLEEKFTGKVVDGDTLEGVLTQQSQPEEKCCFASGATASGRRLQ